MKILKVTLFAFLAIFVVSSVAGFLYFEKKFTPPENHLQVEGISDEVPIEWISNESNPNVALLLPVKVEGISKKFFMQLDFGSPSTIFYSRSLNSLQARFSTVPYSENDREIVSLKFHLGQMEISSDKFKVIDFGEEIDWEQKGMNIIGTIGTDLLERRLTTIDFKMNYCSFSNSRSLSGFKAFDFKKRKLLFPAKIGGERLKLLYDSGTSGYELITSQDEWNKYRLKNTNIELENGNSWGNKLTVILAPAKADVHIGGARLNLSEVTYIEGTSQIQNILMKLSGMQGMIGNKLFLNHTLIIDCKNEKFKVE